MNRCIELALQGLGNTAPNPMVGSVIVHNDEIIGEGYHMNFGGPHAEVNAVHSVKDKSLLKKSTLYVNLEPCTHTGKTPPCTNLIISEGIPEVVIGTADPNSVVNGKGIERLRNSGVKVITDILPEKCNELNKRFFTFHRKKRPFVILKWAQTKDGYIDIIRNSETPVQPNWISNDFSKMLVHKWRSEEQAILIGTNTAIFDNPRLTTREWAGKNPLRILIDNTLRVQEEFAVLDGKTPTLIFSGTHKTKAGKNTFIPLDFSGNDVFYQLLKELYKRDILSVIVEGGRILLESVIEANLWDEARVFTGIRKFNNGIPAPKISSAFVEEHTIQDDILTIYKNSDLDSGNHT